MPIVTRQLRDRPEYAYRILAIGERRDKDSLNSPVYDFLIEQKRRDPKELARLTAQLDKTAESGPPKDKTKFRHLEGSEGIYEFKSPGGLRLFCFWDEKSLIICTHGFHKKSQKTPKGVIETAERWRKAYFEAKVQHTLIHEKRPSP